MRSSRYRARSSPGRDPPGERNPRCSNRPHARAASQKSVPGWGGADPSEQRCGCRGCTPCRAVGRAGKEEGAHSCPQRNVQRNGLPMLGLGLVQVLVKSVGEVWGKMVKPHISALGWEVKLNQPSPKHRSPDHSPGHYGHAAPMGGFHTPTWQPGTPRAHPAHLPGMDLSEPYRSGSSCDLRAGTRGCSPALSKPLHVLSLSSGGSGAGFVPSSALLYAVRGVLLPESVPWHLLHPNLRTLRQGWGHQQ